MYRRTLLAGLATAGVTLAGCGGSDGGGSDAELLVPEFTFEEGPDGTTVVVLTVENPGANRREVTMITTVQGEETDRISVERDVALDPGATETYRVEFDVPWTWFDDNRNLLGVDFVDR